MCLCERGVQPRTTLSTSKGTPPYLAAITSPLPTSAPFCQCAPAALGVQAAAALASSGGALAELAARTAATCGLGPAQLADAAGHMAAALAALAAPERRAALVDAAEHVARAGWCTCGGQKHAPHGHGGGPHGGAGGASARAAAVHDDAGRGLEMGGEQEAEDGREEQEQEQEVPTGARGGGDSTGATGAARSAGLDAGDVLPLGSSRSAGMDTAGAAGEDGSGLGQVGLVLRQYRPGAVVVWVSDDGAVVRQDAAVAGAADDDGDGYGSSSSSSSRSSGAAAIATASGAPARRLNSHYQHRRDQHRSRHRDHPKPHPHPHPHPHRHQHRRRLQQSASAFTSSPGAMRNVQYNYYLPPVPPPEPSSYPPNVLLPLVFHVMLYR